MPLLGDVVNSSSGSFLVAVMFLPANCYCYLKLLLLLIYHFHSFILRVIEKIPSISITVTVAFIRFARISIFRSPWPL